eukprot:TRINITY_DN20655_c0_g1_i1.p1 TRINITY_DN20655_c0_g1~~TRINITY_DN20655_c0_g1_i1.p1  ORF type:complete len:970 (+),score=215.02 TRINITY_DN20655_c0_g1_i1:70-2979(+)
MLRGPVCVAAVCLAAVVHAQGEGTVVFMSATGIHSVKVDGTGAKQLAALSCVDCWGLAVDDTRNLALWTDSSGGTASLYVIDLGGGTPEKRCDGAGIRAFGVSVDTGSGTAFVDNFNGRASGWELYGCDYTAAGGSFAPWPSSAGYRMRTYGDHGGNTVFAGNSVYLTTNGRSKNGPDILQFEDGSSSAKYIGLSGFAYSDYQIGGIDQLGGQLYFAAAEPSTFPAEVFSVSPQGGAVTSVTGAGSGIAGQWIQVRPTQAGFVGSRGRSFSMVGDAPGWIVTVTQTEVRLHDPADLQNPTILYTAQASESAAPGLGPVAVYAPPAVPTASPSKAPAGPPTASPVKTTESPTTGPSAGPVVAPTSPPVAVGSPTQSPAAAPTSPPAVAPTAPPAAAPPPPTASPVLGACPQQPAGAGFTLGQGCAPLLVNAFCAVACAAGYEAETGYTSPVVMTCPAPGTLTGDLKCKAAPTAAPAPGVVAAPTAPPVVQPTKGPLAAGSPTMAPVVAPSAAPAAAAQPTAPPAAGAQPTASPVSTQPPTTTPPPTLEATQDNSSSSDSTLMIIVIVVCVIGLCMIAVLVVAWRQLQRQAAEMLLDPSEKNTTAGKAIMLDESDLHPTADPSIVAAALVAALVAAQADREADAQDRSAPARCPTPECTDLMPSGDDEEEPLLMTASGVRNSSLHFGFAPGDEVIFSHHGHGHGHGHSPHGGGDFVDGVVVRCERTGAGVRYIVRQHGGRSGETFTVHANQVKHPSERQKLNMNSSFRGKRGLTGSPRIVSFCDVPPSPELSYVPLSGAPHTRSFASAAEADAAPAFAPISVAAGGDGTLSLLSFKSGRREADAAIAAGFDSPSPRASTRPPLSPNSSHPLPPPRTRSAGGGKGEITFSPKPRHVARHHNHHHHSSPGDSPQMSPVATPTASNLDSTGRSPARLRETRSWRHSMPSSPPVRVKKSAPGSLDGSLRRETGSL